MLPVTCTPLGTLVEAKLSLGVVDPSPIVQQWRYWGGRVLDEDHGSNTGIPLSNLGLDGRVTV
jgi:hypothetical protein